VSTFAESETIVFEAENEILAIPFRASTIKVPTELDGLLSGNVHGLP